MKLLPVMLAAMSIVLVSGCEIRERSEGGDPHRSWWGQNHPSEAYDNDRAAREHRAYCDRSPDRSCEGWR